MANTNGPPSRRGLQYGPGIRGYYRFRVRETYLRDHVAPMLSNNQLGAVKIDLALRGMARLPNHLGNRPADAVGRTLDRVTYPDLYQLVTSGLPDREDQRAWVRRQILTLENAGLVQRYEHEYRGHDVAVLSDRGNGDPFDDPTGKPKTNDTFITINGTLFAAGIIRDWGAPELAFYLAAMMGEAHDPNPPAMTDRGDGEWWRSYDWFADADGSRRPHGHVRVRFSKRTLIRGRQLLEPAGFVQVAKLTRDPRTGRPFARAGSRNTYLNRFETRAVERLREAGIGVSMIPERDLVAEG